MPAGPAADRLVAVHKVAAALPAPAPAAAVRAAAMLPAPALPVSKVGTVVSVLVQVILVPMEVARPVPPLPTSPLLLLLQAPRTLQQA